MFQISKNKPNPISPGAQSAPKPPSPPVSGGSRSEGSGQMAWRLVVVMTIIFGLFVLLWAGLKFGYEAYLNSKINDVDSQLNTLSSSISKEERGDFIKLYSQLYNIELLADMHYNTPTFFDFVESATYPNVILTRIRIQPEKSIAQIDGVAVNYNTLSDQIYSYKKYSNVENVVLDSSRARDVDEGGGVDFSIKVIMNTSFFK